MFPQRFGTKLYGNRFPLEKEQELSASAKGKAMLDTMFIVILHLVASAKGKAVIVQKDIFFSIKAKTITQVNIVKDVTTTMIAKAIGEAKLHKKPELLPLVGYAVGKANITKKAIKAPIKATAKGMAWITRHFLKIGELAFIGDFEPGDVIEIDAENMTIKKNGENVLHLTEEHFFQLGLGEQEIIYRDAEGERNIKINVQWRDRWL